MPSFGKPKEPKISSQLPMKLTATAETEAIIGIFVSPASRKEEEKQLERANGRKPKHMIRI